MPYEALIIALLPDALVRAPDTYWALILLECALSPFGAHRMRGFFRSILRTFSRRRGLKAPPHGVS